MYSNEGYYNFKNISRNLYFQDIINIAQTAVRILEQIKKKTHFFNVNLFWRNFVKTEKKNY